MAPPKEENGDDGQSSTPEYRDRLRTWLIKMIDSGTIPGLHWENEEKTIFRMPWKHAGRQDYSLEEDSRIFMAWAIHSGRYREGIDKPEPIIWKTRLRCALNKMPDIREIPERSRLDISEPYRVYHFLPPVHKDTQIRRRLQRRHSQAHNSDQQTTMTPRQNSPTYPNGPSRKDLGSTRQMEFQDTRLQNRPNEKISGINHSDFSTRPRLDVRNPSPWLRPTSLVPGAENGLLQGLNLNCLTSPIGARNFVNPYSLFSVSPRDLRQRPEFDFPLLSYPHGGVLDHQALQPFFMPSNGIPAVSAKTLAGTTPFSRNFSLAAMAAEDFRKRNAKTNKIIVDGYSSDTVRNAEEKRSILQDAQQRNSFVQQRKQLSPERILTKSRSDEKDDEKCKIELLELELAKWKRAHDKEKELRESMERQHEHLKRALENMGGDLLAMIMRNYPMNENGKIVKSRDESNTFRRRSAGDAQSQSTSSVREQSRLDRFSEDDKRYRSTQNNGYQSPDGGKTSVIANFSERIESNRKRCVNEENRKSLKPLDLSSSPPLKRFKEDGELDVSSPTSQNKSNGDIKIHPTEYVSQNQYAPYLKFPPSSRDGVSQKDIFRSSRNTSKSSDCDEQEVQLPGSIALTSTALTPVEKSPSTSSSCSSSEENQLGSSSSPNLTRVSPAMPLFRPERDNVYASFKTSINGPIQVT